MSEIYSKLETRGRPRKNVDEKLPPISRKLFSEHCAVFYACCMVYVLEVFLKTKQEKRIGHSEGGFTIYEKISANYCFETLEEDLKEWGFYQVITSHQPLWDFVKTVNGCAPKFVFHELVVLVVGIYQCLEREEVGTIQEVELNKLGFASLPEGELNRQFKYIRFSPAALKELKMEKWAGEVGKKVRELWRPFLTIVSYTVLHLTKGSDKNKYLKPFFSDAEHPEDTIIGQLNLEQIVEEKQEKSPHNLGFIKIQKVNQEDHSESIPKKNDYEQSPSLSERVQMIHRRPITLITFPSNPNMEALPSPSKLLLNSHSQSNQMNALSANEGSLIKEEEGVGVREPCKKIKTQ